MWQANITFSSKHLIYTSKNNNLKIFHLLPLNVPSAFTTGDQHLVSFLLAQ